jgi:hypothetical protein
MRTVYNLCGRLRNCWVSPSGQSVIQPDSKPLSNLRSTKKSWPINRFVASCKVSRRFSIHDLFAEPGSAFLRCISARVSDGVTAAAADCSLFFHPLTISPSPRIIAAKPILATSAGSSFFYLPNLRVHHAGSLEKLGLRRSRHEVSDSDRYL